MDEYEFCLTYFEKPPGNGYQYECLYWIYAGVGPDLRQDMALWDEADQYSLETYTTVEAWQWS